MQQSPEPVFNVSELDAHGIDKQPLLRSQVLRRASASHWQVPDCECGCVPFYDYDSRRAEGLVGVACPTERNCLDGWMWVPSEQLEYYTYSAEALFAALRERNDLEPLRLPFDDGRIAPVGVLRRRGLTLPVVWMVHPWPAFNVLAKAAGDEIGADGAVVLLSNLAGHAPGTLLPGGVVVLDVRHSISGNLGLERALDLLNPSYRTERVDKQGAVFEDVRLQFACEPGVRHIVRLNGHELRGFQLGDLKFLRLLYLAAVQAAGVDDGWTEKWELQGRGKDREVSELRSELAKGKHPDLSSTERRALLKGSPSRDGRVRLAVTPLNVSFDSSLERLTLIGERQAKRKREDREETPGSKEYAEHREVARQIAEQLLEACREKGVRVATATP